MIVSISAFFFLCHLVILKFSDLVNVFQNVSTWGHSLLVSFFMPDRFRVLLCGAMVYPFSFFCQFTVQIPQLECLAIYSFCDYRTFERHTFVSG